MMGTDHPGEYPVYVHGRLPMGPRLQALCDAVIGGYREHWREYQKSSARIVIGPALAAEIRRMAMDDPVRWVSSLNNDAHVVAEAETVMAGMLTVICGVVVVEDQNADPWAWRVEIMRGDVG